MHKLQTTKKRQNKGFFLVFSVVYVVGKVVFLQLKKKENEKKEKAMKSLWLRSEYVGFGVFTQKRGSVKPSRKENLQ